MKKIACVLCGVFGLAGAYAQPTIPVEASAAQAAAGTAGAPYYMSPRRVAGGGGGGISTNAADARYILRSNGFGTNTFIYTNLTLRISGETTKGYISNYLRFGDFVTTEYALGEGVGGNRGGLLWTATQGGPAYGELYMAVTHDGTPPSVNNNELIMSSSKHIGIGIGTAASGKGHLQIGGGAGVLDTNNPSWVFLNGFSGLNDTIPFGWSMPLTFKATWYSNEVVRGMYPGVYSQVLDTNGITALSLFYNKDGDDFVNSGGDTWNKNNIGAHTDFIHIRNATVATNILLTKGHFQVLGNQTNTALGGNGLVNVTVDNNGKLGIGNSANNDTLWGTNAVNGTITNVNTGLGVTTSGGATNLNGHKVVGNSHLQGFSSMSNGSVTVPTLTITNSGDAAFLPAVGVFAPNLTANNRVGIDIGRNNATRNTGTWLFGYMGNGSTANRMDLFFNSQSFYSLGIDTLGNTSVAGWLAPTNGIVGKGDNSSASAGFVGEYVESKIAIGSAVPITPSTATNIISISLTAGDWDVSGNMNYSFTGATLTLATAGISTTSETLPTDGTEVQNGLNLVGATSVNGISVPQKRISLNATTTVYLVGRVNFSVGSTVTYGYMSARRVR